MPDLEKITIPDIGGEAADVVEVLVAPGDSVAVDDGLITLESDKASMDVPSPKAGKVHDIKIKAGDRVEEGALILTLEVGAAVEPPAAEVEPRAATQAPTDTAVAPPPASAPPEAAATPEPAAPGSCHSWACDS